MERSTTLKSFLNRSEDLTVKKLIFKIISFTIPIWSYHKLNFGL